MALNMSVFLRWCQSVFIVELDHEHEKNVIMTIIISKHLDKILTLISIAVPPSPLNRLRGNNYCAY